jgi:putative spermidine/putrescine transport system permease protein
MGSRASGVVRLVSGGRTIRIALLGALALSALGPLALLAVVSLGDRWFFPALWPPRLSAESWRSLLGGRLGYAAATSLVLATSTGVLACLIALPLGRSLARLTGWRRTVGAAAAFLPVAAPPIALGTGLQVSFLSIGLGGTLIGVILAHLVPAVAYVSLYFLGLFLVFDPRIEEEARSLGAGRFDLWRRVLLPLLRRPLAEGFALGFLVSWAQVPLTLLVGGGAVRTLPLEVLAFVRAGQDRYAATGALLLIVPAFLALALGLSARRAEPAPL